MNHRFQFMLCWIIAATMLMNGPRQTIIHAQEKAAPQTQPTWTLNEALAQLQLYPQDAYLQYVALQLARRENRSAEITEQIERLTGNAVAAQVAERRSSVDLFSIFTGALAVQGEFATRRHAHAAGRHAARQRQQAPPGDRACLQSHRPDH